MSDIRRRGLLAAIMGFGASAVALGVTEVRRFSPRFAPGIAVPKTIQHYYGTFPVTERFQTEVFTPYPDLAWKTFGELDDRRRELLAVSTARYNYELHMPDEPMANASHTVAERAELDAIDRVITLHRIANFLGGRPLSDFGFAGLDQVKTGEKDFEPRCGCTYRAVYDRYADGAAPPQAHWPRLVCDAHRA